MAIKIIKIFKYLSINLEENGSKYLSADELFKSIKPAVRNNNFNVPKFRVIKNFVDQGGEFVFIRK